MKIYWEKLLPFLLVLALSLLAGRYLGGNYIIFYRCLITFFILDLLLFIIGWQGLRFNQHFNQEHFTRGEKINYKLYVQQRFFWAANRVVLRFHRLQLGHAFYPDKLDLTLKKGKKSQFEYSVNSSTRGIYHAGLKSITLFDTLGFWELPMGHFPRSFYVYPKIYNPNHQAPPGLSMSGEGESTGQRGLDGSFQNLQEYRPGMDLRNISWKHFARMNRPLLRDQGASTTQSRWILMDRRPLTSRREDLLLECTLAYINSRRGGDTPLTVLGFTPSEPLYIQRDEHWNSLIKGCLTLKFDSSSLVDYPIPEEQPITLITTLGDETLFTGDFWKSRSHWQVFALLEEMDSEEKRIKSNKLEKLRSWGIEVITIEKGEEFWSGASV